MVVRPARLRIGRASALAVVLGLMAAGPYLHATATARPPLRSAGAPAPVAARWKRLAPPGPRPPARMGGLAAWDTRRNALLLFGGWDREVQCDTWALPLDGPAGWRRLARGGAEPPPRFEVTGVFDERRERLWSFGGKDDFRFMNDVWACRLGSQGRWSQVRPRGEPPGPRESRAVLDTRRDRIILACGFGETGSGRAHLAETWVLHLAPPVRWERIEPNDCCPAPRRGHTAVYDARRDRVLVFGGMNDWGYYDDLWALSLGGAPRWTRLKPRGVRPPKRYGHVAAIDARGDRMVVFGGYHGRFLDDAWVLDLRNAPTWRRVAAPEPRPEARDFALAAWDGARGRLLVFGGNQGERVFDDLWSLELAP